MIVKQPQVINVEAWRFAGGRMEYANTLVELTYVIESGYRGHGARGPDKAVAFNLVIADPTHAGVDELPPPGLLEFWQLLSDDEEPRSYDWRHWRFSHVTWRYNLRLELVGHADLTIPEVSGWAYVKHLGNRSPFHG